MQGTNDAHHVPSCWMPRCAGKRTPAPAERERPARGRPLVRRPAPSAGPATPSVAAISTRRHARQLPPYRLTLSALPCTCYTLPPANPTSNKAVLIL